MNALRLYARSRQAGALACALLSVGTGGTALAYVTDRYALASVMPVMLSMSAAALIGVSFHSPFGRTEWTSPHSSLAWVRPLHMLCAYLLALGLLIPAAWRAGAGDSAGAVARGLLGFQGVALICVCLLGAERSWIPVVCLGIAVVSLPLPAAHVSWLWGWAGTQGGGAAAWASAVAVQASAWTMDRRGIARSIARFVPGTRKRRGRDGMGCYEA